MPDWIPCSERLPDYGVDVLIYAGVFDLAIFAPNPMRDGEDRWFGMEQTYLPKTVTHWQPLPDPPQ